MLAYGLLSTGSRTPDEIPESVFTLYTDGDPGA